MIPNNNLIRYQAIDANLCGELMETRTVVESFRPCLFGVFEGGFWEQWVEIDKENLLETMPSGFETLKRTRP